jgi:glucuronate isomerase
MGFITEDFLLQSKTARHLYRAYAEPQPILDYHCHLSAADIANDRRFQNLFEIWLEGDHYKWRAMRANGVPEQYCTGSAGPYEKFLAWASTVPKTLRNAQYHWTHLELRRYFGIDSLLDEGTALNVWERANEQLAIGELSAQGILKKFRVKALCTTDDPADSLENHDKIRESGLETKVFPAFRPDKALQTQDASAFNAWTDRLAVAANSDIVHFQDFLNALRRRHDDFHEVGCRLSDHGMEHCYDEPCSEEQASRIFAAVRAGKSIEIAESLKFAAYLMFFFGVLDTEKGWTKQLHLGAYRNANTRMGKLLGPDAGFDSIGDWPQTHALARYLDRLDSACMLPKMIVYNSNPENNYVFATLIGSFQDGTVRIAGCSPDLSAW